MPPPGPEAPVVIVKWYDYAKWLMQRVDSFPKDQRFILGQRLANHVMDALNFRLKHPSEREFESPACQSG